MPNLSEISRLGVFRGSTSGLSSKQRSALVAQGTIVRMLPDVYRMAALPASHLNRLRAALLWAGDLAAGAARSAGTLYELEGVRTFRPEIVTAGTQRLRSSDVTVHRASDRRALMVRTVNGIRLTGPEATLVALAHVLDDEALEVACEDARRRKLTSVPALRTYLRRWPGRRGASALRELLDQLDPVHPSRSTLEVKTRRLLVANGITDFVREFPLESGGRTYSFDFAFPDRKLILETNGRRWHDDPADYEYDNEKWSVPARYGFRIEFATWQKVTQAPDTLVAALWAA